MIEIWVDGACPGNPGPIGVGVVIVDGDRRVSVGHKIGRGTSNEAELHAIRYALIMAMPLIKTQPCIIYSDSKYAIGSIETGKGHSPIHGAIHKLLAMANYCEFKFVKGHSGNGYNELADALATNAAAGTEVLDDNDHCEIRVGTP